MDLSNGNWLAWRIRSPNGKRKPNLHHPSCNHYTLDGVETICGRAIPSSTELPLLQTETTDYCKKCQGIIKRGGLLKPTRKSLGNLKAANYNK